MAEIAVQSLTSLVSGPLAAGAAKLTFVAATLAGDQCSLTGREMVIVRNDDAAAQTITFDASKDRLGRDVDITSYSIPAAETHAFGPFTLEGWDQGGKLKFVASDVDMKIAVVRMPF